MRLVPLDAGWYKRKKTLRRSVIVLTSSAAALYLLVGVVSGLSALATEKLFGTNVLAGLGPALIFGTAGGVSVLAGYLSDRLGRRRVLVMGFFTGGLGAVAVGGSLIIGSSTFFVGALLLIGTGIGALRLVKTAAADIYPRQARSAGMGLVQTGALAGALLGLMIAMIWPSDHLRTTAMLWLLTGAILTIFAVLVFSLLKPDPLEIAKSFENVGQNDSQNVPILQARSVWVMLRSSASIPGVLMTICMIYGVMVMTMSLAGTILHRQGVGTMVIMGVMATHFMSMFGLMHLVGQWTSRYNRQMLALIGTVLVLAGTITMAGVPPTPIALTGCLLLIGVGWCMTWMAGMGQLADYARHNERGALMSIADLGSDILAAAITLLGGTVLGAYHMQGFALLGILACIGSMLTTLFWWKRTP